MTPKIECEQHHTGLLVGDLDAAIDFYHQQARFLAGVQVGRSADDGRRQPGPRPDISRSGRTVAQGRLSLLCHQRRRRLLRVSSKQRRRNRCNRSAIANTRYAIMPSATCTATSCRSDIVYAGEYKMKPIYLAVASFALGAVCFASISQPDRTADAEAIRAHIGSIFQAFIDGDEQKIFDTHSEDWRGLLEGTRRRSKASTSTCARTASIGPKPRTRRSGRRISRPAPLTR